MAFVARPSIPALRPYVRALFCVAMDEVTSSERASDRVLPGGGTVELCVNLLEDEVIVDDGGPVRIRSGAMVAGPRTRSYRVDARRRTLAVGVHFNPGGAFAFLGISPAEIVNHHVPLGDLWGSDGNGLRERLLEVNTTEARFQILEALLLRRMVRARHPAIGSALRALGDETRVAEVASLVGLGRRRLRDVFTCEVGLAPKLYARLQRFHEVKQRVARAQEQPSWAALAATCGYADQSHLIRDFLDFAGVTPSAYLRTRTGETRLDHEVHAFPFERMH